MAYQVNNKHYFKKHQIANYSLSPELIFLQLLLESLLTV